METVEQTRFRAYTEASTTLEYVSDPYPVEEPADRVFDLMVGLIGGELLNWRWNAHRFDVTVERLRYMLRADLDPEFDDEKESN